MEEIEIPTEHLHEEMQHQAEEVYKSKEKWILGVALSSALLAVFAAISSLMAGHYANEAMILQMKSSDQWAFYQAKDTRIAILQTKQDLLAGLRSPPQEEVKKLQEYQNEKEAIRHEAEKTGKESDVSFKIHNRLARSVTLFQIAIAIGAISALTKKKPFWLFSIVFGIGGIYFLFRSVF
ncbi:MAG: DUF4337 domain-containing protein [Deltaproteobacteria bacterium]|nr:DUF4337 domain-containing protein [Deltaproteobacteria bacterium]